MNIKNFVVNNIGLKVLALFLAIFVWAMISGKERSSSETNLDVNVEYFNVPKDIDVRSIQPAKVRLTVQGTTKQLEKIDVGDFQIKINLKDVTEGTRYYFAENYLIKPEEFTDRDVQIHQRMIEITVKEFMTREVTVRVRYSGNMPQNVRLNDRRVTPDKVKIFGYKTNIASINTINAVKSVNLSEIYESTVIQIPLEKTKEILRFVDGVDSVKVYVDAENLNKPKENKQTKNDQTKEQ